MSNEEAIFHLSDLRSYYNCFDQDEADTYHALSMGIEALKEQKHGKWNPVRIVDEHGNEHPFDGFQCSNCGNIGREWMQYCFNCGAKMDGE